MDAMERDTVSGEMDVMERRCFRGDAIEGSKAQLRNQIEQLSISRKTSDEIKDVFSQLQNILC